jgi:hypothetical protein
MEKAGFTIRDGPCLAKLFHGSLRHLESVPGHVWKEVVLNLIVQAAKTEVGHWVRSDISGREDLLSEAIQPVGALQHEHPFMIGRKDNAHIKSKQHLMYQDEDDSLP